jgi:hypothetical protein
LTQWHKLILAFQVGCGGSIARASGDYCTIMTQVQINFSQMHDETQSCLRAVHLK